MAEAVRAFNSSTLNLPKRLLDFFARYPPELYSAKFTGITLPLTRKESKEAAIARNVAAPAASAQTSQTITADAATSEELTPPTPTPASSLSYVVVDTGQEKCYNNSREITYPKPGEAFYGQDAQYQGIQPTYRDNGNGTITDLNTGLMWQ